jgi:hypothetical protein
MEFATEIGQNLLVEVRRLQALLSERDRALEKFSEERDGWESERNGMLAAVRTAEGNTGEINYFFRRALLIVRTLQGGELES